MKCVLYKEYETKKNSQQKNTGQNKKTHKNFSIIKQLNNQNT